MYFMQSKPFRLALEKKFLVCLTWGAPEIINTSRGNQCVAEAFIMAVHDRSCKLSMGGRILAGQCFCATAVAVGQARRGGYPSQ